MKKGNYKRYPLEEQIKQKNSEYLFFGTEEGARNNKTTYKHFPPISRNFERQTGMIKHKHVKPIQHDVIEHNLNHCFQTSCSTVFPCKKNEEDCILLYR